MQLNLNDNDVKICKLSVETKEILKEYFKNKLEKEQNSLFYCKTLEDFIKVQTLIVFYASFINLLELKK